MNNPFDVPDNSAACVLSDSDVTTLCYLLRIAKYDDVNSYNLAQKIYKKLDTICWLSNESVLNE